MQLRNTTRKFFGFALVPLMSATLALGTAHAQRDDRHNDDHRDDRNQQHDNQRHEDFRFQDQHRNTFQSHYGSDANRWRSRNNRAHFQVGQRAPDNYRFQSVPSSYYRGAPQPPAGYRYGYYQGYVVAYNPTTRIIADILDLASGH